MDEFQTRRNKLAAQLQNDSIMLLPSAKLQYRNDDVEYPFRQNSDFYYLTGFTEPEAVMVLTKDHKGTVSFVLFNQAHDPVFEVWHGKRAGQEGAKETFKADQSFDINNIDHELPNLFINKQIVYYPLAEHKEFDLKVLQWLNLARQLYYSKARSYYRNAGSDAQLRGVPGTFIDVLPMISELRVIKSAQEIANMRKAAEISAAGHLLLIQTRKPGQLEYQLEAKFNAFCLDAGCRGVAYNTIVASGNNSCTLHYTVNDQVLKSGDLVLVDAGGEYNYYAADITRTFPVSGKFSVEQRQIYNIVLEAQLAGIDQVKPGNRLDKVQTVIIEIIVRGLVQLGILNGDIKQLIKDHEYNKFYMHSSGHWLGLDVHDSGKYKINNEYRKFEPGMVVTVEPGIYIANTLTGVDSKWLGIGVRIEDDVLVTSNGHEVLSKNAPKTIDEIESAAV